MHSQVHQLIGVYHAEGGLTGELRYVVGKLLGTASPADPVPPRDSGG
jgi:hypothetical protein